MKPFLFILLICAASPTLAQSSSSLNTVINEDGKTMSILVEGDRNGRTIKYNRSFDVTRLNSAEKEALKSRVLDSLGIGESAAATEVVTQRDRTTAAGREGVTVPTKPTTKGAVPTPQPPVPPADAGQTMVTFTCESCTGKVKLMLASATEDYSVERDAKAGTDKRFFPYKLSLSSGEYQLTYYQNGVLQIQSTFTVKAGETSTVVIK